MSVTRRFEMASPNPVPPYFLVVELSACVNDWNKVRWASWDNPIPVSATLKCRVNPPSGFGVADTWTETLPELVNLMALPIRFKRI